MCTYVKINVYGYALYVCLSICLSVCMYACLYVCLPVYMYVMYECDVV